MLDTVAVVGGEIISVTVAVTLKRLVWGETAGPCVSDDHRTCGGDVFIIPPPREPGAVGHTTRSLPTFPGWQCGVETLEVGSAAGCLGSQAQSHHLPS